MTTLMTKSNPGRIVYYIDGRLFEWTMTLGKLVLGIQLFFLPEMMKMVPFQWIGLFIGPKTLAFLMVLTGLIRLGALIANGASLVIGPYLRSLMALFASALWLEFGISFLIGSIHRGFGGPIPFWFVFSISEMYIVYRAVLDVRSNR